MARPRVSWRDLVSVVALVLGAGVPSDASGQTAAEGCFERPGFYESEGYRIRQIIVESPFDFVGSFRGVLAEARERLPVRAGEAYRGELVTNGVAVLEEAARRETAAVLSPVEVTATIAYLTDCVSDGAGKSLVVAYRVYTSRLPLSYTRTFEAGSRVATNPAAAAGVSSRRLIHVEPSVRYNRTDKVSVGVRAAARDFLRVGAFDAEVQASTRMQTVSVSAADSRSLDAAGLNTISWRVDYRYADLPLNVGARRTHVGGALFSLDFAHLPGGALLRAGAAVEGGRAGSTLAAVSLPPETVASSEIFSVKAFAGASWQTPRHSLRLSYGLQASSTGEGFDGGFTKQLVDATYRARVLPVDYRPLDIDLRFTAGWIANGGRLPVSERFFGGNVPEEFLPVASWSIRANPLIRSFARAELADDGVFAAGGERFLAVNLNLAPTVWGRPLVPPDLVANPEFQSRVDAGLSSAESFLEQSYANDSPAFRAFVAVNVEELRELLSESLDSIRAAFAPLEESIPAEQQDRWEECDVTVEGAQLALDNLEIEGSSVLVTFRTLSAPDRQLDNVLGCVEDPIFSAVREKMLAASAAVRDAQARMRTSLSLIDERETTARAREALQPARNVLDRFFHELTLASVAPIALFDVARLGRSDSGFRYAVGAGVRFSLVSAMHLTTVYAVNPDRRPGERRGTLLFSFDVAEFLF
jgi:hypothetical protein